MNDFVPALLKELEQRKDYLHDASVGTVYFGGGTPSLLEPAALYTVLDDIRKQFNLDPAAEITLEANPDDMTDRQKMIDWRSAGINRLSIGVQSFFDEDLRWMNRAHQANQARESIRLAKEAGFDNLSIDLIYGGPTLPDDHWRRNVMEAVNWQIPHLSCYALTVEPRTALDKLIHNHKREAVNADDQARQLLLLMDWMARAGYEHYEISNFALPGHRSRHNSSYWQGQPYLGLGPSAHSYDGSSREWNIANNARYIAALNLGSLPVAEREVLTAVQQFNEYVMVSLRTLEGIDLPTVRDRWGSDALAGLLHRARRHIQNGMLLQTDNPLSTDNLFQTETFPRTDNLLLQKIRLKLTNEGKLLADGIAADLFIDAAGAL